MGLFTKLDEPYNKEEEALCYELCNMINADKELKGFFKKRVTKILQTFMEDVVVGRMMKDTKRVGDSAMEATEMIKALTMHVYVKVTMKKQATK